MLRSAVLTDIGVPHGFSTRVGGVSAGIFSSLNFGNPGDLAAERRDPAETIAENWRLLAVEIGDAHSARRIVQVHQVHGGAVHTELRGEVTRAAAGDVRADAIVTDDGGAFAAVRVADCTPVLVATADGAAVAAIHAGWRGVVGEVVKAAVEEVRRVAPESARRGLGAAIGPCIGPGAFEVGEEVAEEFWEKFGKRSVHVLPGQAAGKWFVDLKGAIKEQLERLKVREIDVIPGCTASDDAERGWFFSHRRDKGVTGRMVGIIGPK